jgi:hypothetical protein
MKSNMKNTGDTSFSKKSSQIEEHDESTRSQSFENTNDILFNQQKEFVLNKKLVKISGASKPKKITNKKFSLKPKIFNEEYDDINMEKWFKNRIKITYDEKNSKKVLYKFFTEEKHKSQSCALFAGKENGIYVIRNNEGIVAKIRWNIFSNHFKVYDDKDNLIEEIIYTFNFKGWNGPTKLQILIPKTPSKKSLYKTKNRQILHKIINIMPNFNEIFHTYVLKFIRRKVIPNERNMQVIFSEYKEDNKNVLLQFAQSNRNEFILDYKYPFTNITAFALAITSLSSRTFCK